MKRKSSSCIVVRVSCLAATASTLILVAVLSNCGGKSQPPPALTMGPSSLPNLSVGVPTGPADLVINANGGVGPYNWSVSAGSLPHGISLSPFPPGSPANGGFVALSGTPDTAARVNVTIQVTDSARQSASQAVWLDPIQTRLTRAPAHSPVARTCSYQNQNAPRSDARPAAPPPVRNSIRAALAIS